MFVINDDDYSLECLIGYRHPSLGDDKPEVVYCPWIPVMFKNDEERQAFYKEHNIKPEDLKPIDICGGSSENLY